MCLEYINRCLEYINRCLEYIMCIQSLTYKVAYYVFHRCGSSLLFQYGFRKVEQMIRQTGYLSFCLAFGQSQHRQRVTNIKAKPI